MTHQLARYETLIREQFPQLHVQSVEYLAHGKDNVAVLVNKDLIFRFPKRLDSRAKLAMEIVLLPELASTLALPIPQFVYIGRGTHGTHNPPAADDLFVGYQRLPGIPLTEYMPQIWDEDWWKPSVGQFLTDLHQFSIARAQELGVPGGTAEEWRSAYQEFYQTVQVRVHPLVTGAQRAGITQYFERYLNDPHNFTFMPVLLHADLYSGHVLFDTLAKSVTGIIDFSECRIGDPAFDIRNAWEPFYRGDRADNWQARRRFFYLLQPLVEIAYSNANSGLEEMNPKVREQALHRLNEIWES
jgi:aminoglycoside 2''-phosphotransferase